MRVTFAAGDPQTTPERFFTVLRRYDLLAADGRLRDDVGLVSMGDHFDFHGELSEVERAGRTILEWLLSHPAEQVQILAGNHDLARVMELAFETDASFAEAKRTPPEEFASRFPRIPTLGVANRDYVSFSEAQRALVQRALLEGRMRLALTATIPTIASGTRALFTHAGVTQRELALLGFPPEAEPDAETIARALEARLDRAIEAVREAWTQGRPAELDLSPLHVPGTTGQEGGGLLYHRASSAKTKWALDPDRPRRFDPRSLPRHLVQVAGHTTHPKCLEELEGWIDPSAHDQHLAIRTLLVAEGEPRYRAGVDARPGSLVMIDPGFAKAPIDTIELLPITG
jgi:hypothetical protein